MVPSEAWLGIPALKEGATVLSTAEACGGSVVVNWVGVRETDLTMGALMHPYPECLPEGEVRKEDVSLQDVTDLPLNPLAQPLPIHSNFTAGNGFLTCKCVQ